MTATVAAPVSIADVLAKLSKGKGAKFASFVYRAKGTGELAKHMVILGAITENVYQKDIEALTALLPSLAGMEKLAAEKIIASRQESLVKGIGNNSQYVHSPENADTYVNVDGIAGVKVNKRNGLIYIMCLSNGKVVLEPSQKPPRKYGELAAAKYDVMKRAGGRGDHIRQFIIKNLREVRMNGEVMELDGDVEMGW